LSTTADAGSLIAHTLATSRMLAMYAVLAYGVLFVFIPFVFAFIHERRAAKAKYDLEQRHLDIKL